MLSLVGTDPLEVRVVSGGSRQGYSRPLLARALATGRPVVHGEGPGEDGGDAGVQGEVRSALCAPIFNRGRVVACCYLTHGRVGALFGEEEIRLAEFIATLAGSALENAEGFAEVQALTRSLEKRVDERTAELAEANRQLTESARSVDLLRRVAVATNEAATVDDALQVALDEVCQHTGWPIGHVSRVSSGQDPGLVPTDIWHVANPERFGAFRRVVDATRHPVGTGLGGRVAASGAPQWIRDMTAEAQLRPVALAPGLGVRSGFAVPAPDGDRSVAILEFFSPETVARDQALLDLVAQVGIELGRVAERKRAEDALRRNEERTRSILAAANDGFVGMDNAGMVTDWNRSAEVIFGWSATEAVGRRLSDAIIPPFLRQDHEQGLARFLATGDGPIMGRRVEVVAQHRDGHEFPAELSIWHTGEGSKHSFNAFVQDITERKQTEEALAVARDQAMEASRMKSEFLATMSHEIRTPMNGVIGLAGLLLDTDLGPHQRPYAEGLRTAGEALLTVINDILDFSKIEAGKLELEDVEFDPHHLVDEVVQLMAESAHAKGLEIVGACSPALPARLRGDPGRLRQILANLASNAVKFTESGEVAVRAEPVDGLMVRFEVSDTGIGIDPADRDHILEPFSQADASTTRRYGGTGLGLAISTQLTQAMGGVMTLESRVGVGSTFRVTVPFSGRRDDVPSSLDPRLMGRRVLVVDDNATSGSVLEAQLAAWGARPEVVADGPAALRRLEAAAAEGAAFDVAVIDVAMPGMDGVELAGHVNRNPVLEPTRIVLLTTRLVLDAETAARLGVTESVPKPVHLPGLRDSLVRLLARTPVRQVAAPAASQFGDRGRVLVVEDNPTNQLVARGLLAKLGYRPDVVSNGVQAVEAVARAAYAAVLMDCNMPVMDGYEATGAIR
ncbi:MAG: ATP-binding protein, partial [Actinomycetota bacterium]|nr:ATP-binding protein [Actinomycetota bacterium]